MIAADEVRMLVRSCGGLVNLTALAARWGVQKSVASRHVNAQGFPPPLYDGKERLWLWHEADAAYRGPRHRTPPDTP